jgi:autoinducer 2-degrading protein
MYVTIVHVKVKTDHIEDFIVASEANHHLSVKEAGNLRFDVLQKHEDPGEFALYEAYESQEAAAAHKKTAHYLAWREKVAPWMAVPRKGVSYQGLLP